MGRSASLPRTISDQYVANVETPVLILEGEHDTPHEAELYTTYLRALGKDVTYVLYKGEGHSLSKVSHRKDRWERTLGWFRKYLIRFKLTSFSR